MKSTSFAAIILAGATLAAGAQTTSTKPATTAKPHTATTAHATTLVPKLPPGIPPIKAPAKNFFANPIRYIYQDQVIGTGPVAEPGKLYTIHYTGYFASNGVKFDSSHDHPASPVIGKDGKPELDKDGKPLKEPGQPIQFLQGVGRTIPGFDMGFDGMRVGGKRRIFIPWQLGYGLRDIKSPDPAHHPDIPPKSDLIFDVELLNVADLPARPQMPMNMQGRPGMLPHPGMQTHPGQPEEPGKPNAAPTAGPSNPASTTSGASPKANAPSTAPAATPATAPTAGPTNPASTTSGAPAKPNN